MICGNADVVSMEFSASQGWRAVLGMAANAEVFAVTLKLSHDDIAVYLVG